eukprot:6706010-Prymnesium_polylepis.1
MAVRALAAPWSVFGTLGGGGSIHQYPVEVEAGHTGHKKQHSVEEVPAYSRAATPGMGDVPQP